MTSSPDAGTEPRVRGVKRVGAVVVIVGGLLTALAYWVLPVAAIPLVGSLTAPALLDQISDSAAFGLLRLVPLAAIGTILLGGALLFGSRRARFGLVEAVLALLCAVVTAVAYLIPLGKVEDAITSSGASSLGLRATTFTGAGFWVALIGAIIAIVGAVVEIVATRAHARR